MELLFKTTNPSKLKTDIIKLIDEGKLLTWKKYEEYIIHTQQWGEKGVIKMKIDENNNQLIVRVLKFKKTKEEVKDFEGYYLGRFCEIIFVNFPKSFSTIVNK